MYAVIRTGGKQYKVAENDVLFIEKLDGKEGEELTFSDVLAFHDGKELTLGQPLVSGATVTADVLDQKKGAKVIVFKKKRRQNYRRKKGHRQLTTVIRITAILPDGKKKAAAKKAAPAKADAPAKAEAPEAAPAKKPAAKKPAAKKPAADKK
jgi:large subunit ribosomal protein L21